MGGDHLHSFASEDESSTLENDDDYSEISSYTSSFCRGFDEVGHGIHPNPVEFDACLRRRKISYNEIMRNYDELWTRRECLYQAKNKILSYSPGAWISSAGNKTLQDYVLPKTTSLLLVGPKGSGKSNLVNRISRVFEHDKFASERAQVTYNSYTEEGTSFLQEYMIPRSSPSDSDSPRLKMSLKCKAQQSGTPSKEIKKVNFVVFVVNGLSVLRAMNSHKEEARRYMELVIKTFSCPYISFKDDKPVIVVTHGDLLSLGDRARVRVYLGEKLGVPPAKQIFDIPDNADPLTELTIVDMVKYALEHADKHMPCRESREWMDRSKFSIDKFKYEVSFSWIFTLMFLAMLLGIACIAFPMHQSHNHNSLIPESAKSRMSSPYESHDHLVTFPSHSYSDSKSAINYSQNNKPQLKSPQTLSSKSRVNPQGYEYKEPESKTSHENREQENPKLEEEDQKFEVTSNLLSQSMSENEQIQSWVAEHDAKPASSASLDPRVTSSSTPPLKSAGSKSRSPSPEKRHPKSAVKWHKVRHLWLDD
ncbi:hypothetical protein KSS87_020511 [Heliosperma pusillum]|nr:hypothetical protein KSS87_020511 [Heliosperma pusillum]